MELQTFTATDLFTLLSSKESLSLISIGHLKISGRALAKKIDKILLPFLPICNLLQSMR